MRQPKRARSHYVGSEPWVVRGQGAKSRPVLGRMVPRTDAEGAAGLEVVMRESFVVHGQPRPWRAPFTGRNKRGGTFTKSPEGMVEYQKLVHATVRSEMMKRGLVGRWPLKASLYRMSVRAYFDNALFCDAVNLRKNLEDSVEGLLYDNDRWLDHGPCDRFYDPKNPRVEFVIEAFEVIR